MPPNRYQHLDRIAAKAKALEKYHFTVGELVFVGSFVANFVVGTVINYTSTNEATHNYYNDKKNFINQIFVKKGWFWTTLVLVVFYAHVIYIKHPRFQWKNAKFIVLNYIISTGWWILFTQWCFGMPIMDRIFVWTGGKCVDVLQENLSDVHSAKFIQNNNIFESNLISSKICRSLKGTWHGGHDPSGHSFILIHSSLYLFFEIAPYFVGWSSLVQSIRKIKYERSRAAGVKKVVMGNPWMPVAVLIGLWSFMLLMTNVYFHSILEKLVGLVFGYGVMVSYAVQRAVPGPGRASSVQR